MKKQEKLPSRNPVRFVEKMEVRDNLLLASRARGHKGAQQIINSVPPDLDLIAANGQYYEA